MSDSSEIDVEAIKKQKVLNLAFNEANKWALGTGLTVGLATLLANYRSKQFNQWMSVSAKVSLPIMATLGIWSYKYEVVMNDAKRFPERWGLTEESLEVEKQRAAIAAAERNSWAVMPLHHRALNYIYDHPFQWVAGLGVPLTLAILNEQKHNTHLTFSQKIMHSRVFAQGGILIILLTTMGFREYIDRNGRFPDPSDQAPSTPSEENSD